MLKVKVFEICGKYGLKLAEKDNEQILPYTPRWKTEKGALRYAEKNGMIVVK